MQSELKSLSKIFSETLLRIPDYQRGYAWGAKQLKDFWNDIEQLSDGRSHYTGVLTLQPAEDHEKWDGDSWIIKSKKYTPLYVVDGQQRLTTAVLLLQSILDKIDDNQTLNYTSKTEIQKKYIFESKDGGISRSYIFGYDKDNPSDEFLKSRIFGTPSDKHSVAEETIYTSNLANAKDFFAERLRSLSHPDLERVFTRVTQNLLFNIFYIEPELDVFVTFETMNNRGKQLSHLELLKNRLIYLSTKFEIDATEREALRSAINESWKSVYHKLGKIKSRRFDDDTFLQTHFFCHFGATPLKYTDIDGDEQEYSWRYLSRDDEFFKDYLLDEHFTVRRVGLPSKAGGISAAQVYEYARSVRSVADTFQMVANPDNDNTTADERTVLEQLNRIESHRLFLITVVTYRTIRSKEKRLQLFRELERVGFLSKIRPQLFFELHVDELASDLLGKRIGPEDLIAKIRDFADKVVSSNEFREAIRSLGRSGGFYSWGAARYFMYEYEQHLRTLSKTTRQLLDWREDDEREAYDADHRTVEHIYPQRASHSYWKERFNAFSVQERNILKGSLGNLLPISHPKNSSLGNDSFPEKLGTADRQVGYRYGCLSEIQVSMEPEWTPTAILQRGLRLLAFMEKRWSVNLGTPEEKIDLLSLRFVANAQNLIAVDLLSAKAPIPSAPTAQSKPQSKPGHP
jgi:hypothetical protein